MMRSDNDALWDELKAEAKEAVGKLRIPVSEEGFLEYKNNQDPRDSDFTGDRHEMDGQPTLNLNLAFKYASTVRGLTEPSWMIRGNLVRAIIDNDRSGLDKAKRELIGLIADNVTDLAAAQRYVRQYSEAYQSAAERLWGAQTKGR